MFHYLILLSILHLKGQRSTASIYHIINGRRSTQTIQDAHLYQLTNLYAIYDQLRRNDFEQTIVHLVKRNYITIDRDDNAILTKKGQKYIIDNQTLYPIQSFKGLDYADKTKTFIDRLLLTLQTYTNLSMENNQFSPIVEDLSIQKWVRKFYQQQQGVQNWLIDVYQVLMNFLQTIDELRAKIFVERITSYRKFGLTIQQLATKYNRSPHDISLLLMANYQALINFIEVNKLDILAVFIPNKGEQQVEKFITQSAQKTYQLIKQGHSIDQIINLRHLKRSTIEDHVVELAYQVPDFNIYPFINQEDLTYVLMNLKEIEDQRLSHIKKKLDDRFSYFQIRLAMANLHLLVD